MSSNFISTAEIDINAPAEKIWKALTTPEIIKQYFFGTDVKSDWKVGSPIVYSGVWEDKPYEDPGTILAIEENKLLEINHRSGKDPDVPESYHNIKFALSPNENGTKVVIIQNNNKTEDAQTHSNQMWKMVLDGLKKTVEHQI